MRPNELNVLMSGIMTIVVSGVLSIVVKGLMTIVVTVVVSDYSETPLESIVVSHESLDYSSESECVVVIE